MPSQTPDWTCEHAVDVNVPPTFAWHYMTDVRNWNDPPAEFAIDGPFIDGARGTTRMPEQPAASWIVRDVVPMSGYTIVGGEGLLRDAEMRSIWRFDALSGSPAETRMTQRMELAGDNAAAYVDEFRAAFEPNLEPGMRRIAGLMEDAYRRR